MFQIRDDVDVNAIPPQRVGFGFRKPLDALQPGQHFVVPPKIQGREIRLALHSAVGRARARWPDREFSTRWDEAEGVFRVFRLS